MRVPLRITRDNYDVYVGDDHLIRYDEQTLPDILKVKLAMVKAAPAPAEYPTHITPLAYFPNCVATGMEDIGWKTNDGYYCLILSRKELSGLEGKRQKTNLSSHGWTDYRAILK